ncbi:MAG: hypothetical protein ABI779_06135 [Acidobacteriota bacterium]
MKKTIALLLFTTSAALAQKPADVTIQQVIDRRSNGSFAELSITLQLPKVMSSQVAASRVLVKTAVDDTGQSLINAELQEPELDANMRGTMSRSSEDSPIQVSMTLKNPSRKAKKVGDVRGEIELFMPSKDPNSLAEVPKFLSFSGKTLNHKALKANGVEITLVSAAQVAAEKKRIGDAKRKEFKEAGYEDGENLEQMVQSTLDYALSFEPSDVPVRIKDPNKRIQQIAYVDAAGEVKQVMLRDAGEGLQKLATWGDAPQPDWRLRVSLKTPKNLVRYPFALKDVVLP